jgi:uncharacterized protein
MQGLEFSVATPVTAFTPVRVDVGCFVGFAGRRALPTGSNTLDALPEWLRAWFDQYAWRPGRDGRTEEDLVQLRDVPVPIDSWDAFDDLFAWDARPLDAERECDSVLGAAVRRFFAEGGRRCYVIRLGDPWPYFVARNTRVAMVNRIFPRFVKPTPADRSTWRGVGHLLGLSDVSFLCAPDMPEIFSTETRPHPPEVESEGEERFIECGTRVAPAESRSLRDVVPSQCDENGFGEWADRINDIGEFLRTNAALREIQFIAAIPLALDRKALAADPAVAALPRERRASAIQRRVFAAMQAQWNAVSQIQSAFVQLAFPWLQTRESALLPGDIEAPDAMLAGILANNALTRSTWRVAARQPLNNLVSVEPILTRADLAQSLGFQPVEGRTALATTLEERISVFGPTARGLQLLSDVTTDDDPIYRAANVNRLVSAVVRVARSIAEQSVFANNGPALWRRVRDALFGLLHSMWSEGAFEGATPVEAFAVRCDRTTMTQQDIDSGRAIVQVEFKAAAPILKILIVLAMDEGGQVTLISTRAQGARLEAA